MEKNKKINTSYFDYSLLFMTVFMICFGLVMLYSASSFEAAMELGSATFYIQKQIISVVVGSIAMLVLVKLDYHIFKNGTLALAIYVFGLFLPFVVLTPLGVEANGAKRWINLGMSIQVCEIVKVCVIIFMAFIIDRVSKRLKNFGTYFICLMFVGVCAAIVMKVTSDLSSAIVIGAIGVVMLFVACRKILYTMFSVVCASIVAVLAVISEDYRMDRVRAWLDPMKYKKGEGYQILQSLYSLGSGGIFGKGLGKGIQKLGYVPEAQNDMIFTVICEELGVIGGIAVICMFVFLVYRFLIIASNAPDLFGSMLVIGVMAHISVQTLLNIAVVSNLMPNTGVTLPFMSYGGSSIICLMAEIGIVLSVSKRIRYD